MSIFKTRLFTRWARKQGLQDSMLCQAVREIGGFRTIVATRDGDRCFFVYGFAKNEWSNMDDEEEVAFKALAKTLLTMPPAALARAEGAGEVMKVDDDA